MNEYSKIEESIQNFKEVNRAAGEELHRQFSTCASGKYSRQELENIVIGDEDVADDHYTQDEDYLHAEVREIQHSIINFFS